METETLEAMNEGMYPNLLPMVEIVALIAAFFAVAGLAIYLAGVVWLCFEEMRQPARRRMKPAPPEPDKYDPLAALAALDVDLGDSLTGGVSRREPAL